MSENYAANMQSLLILTILTTFIPTIIGLTLGDLYPFGNQIGDTAMERNDDGSSGEIPISTLFPFFNHQHQKLIVSKMIVYVQIRYCFFLFENYLKAASPIKNYHHNFTFFPMYFKITFLSFSQTYRAYRIRRTDKNQLAVLLFYQVKCDVISLP